MSVDDATQKFLLDAGIRRYGQPEEIAELMAFLISPGARWMTGAALRMDGGEVTYETRAPDRLTGRRQQRKVCRPSRCQAP